MFKSFTIYTVCLVVVIATLFGIVRVIIYDQFNFERFLYMLMLAQLMGMTISVAYLYYTREPDEENGSSNNQY